MSEEVLRRFDRLCIGQAPVFVLQDAPRPQDRDREALAHGTAMRRDAVRLWGLGDYALERAVFINAYPAPPCKLLSPWDVAAARIEVVLGILAGRVSVIVAAGAWQRWPVSRVLALRRAPDCNQVLHAEGMDVAAIYHPSPRGRAYNPDGSGLAGVSIVRRLLGI